MKYLVKTPWIVQKLLPSYIWSIDTKDKLIYLSFDDGPHPVATPFVLDELNKYNAKATFFCIGKNVVAHPAIYQRILAEGHAVGNHTQNHLNGWKNNDDMYVNDIREASKYIQTGLFRPPYGRIRSSQAKKIGNGTSIIMWSVLSGDFDTAISVEKCFNNVVKHSTAGSIVVFHDSEKAFRLVKEVLPKTLEFFSDKGYQFEKIVKKNG